MPRINSIKMTFPSIFPLLSEQLSLPSESVDMNSHHYSCRGMPTRRLPPYVNARVVAGSDSDALHRRRPFRLQHPPVRPTRYKKVSENGDRWVIVILSGLGEQNSCSALD